MGPPPPRRQPAARPGASDSPSGTGMGTGGARGAGEHWARKRNFPRPAALRCAAPGPRGRDHPARVPPRGAGGSGEAGRAATGGGEGGGAREDDERRAALPRRLGGALPAPRASRPHPRPAARTHSRAQPAGPATSLRGSASDWGSEAAHISNLQAGVVLVHAATRANALPDEWSSSLQEGAATRPHSLPRLGN